MSSEKTKLKALMKLCKENNVQFLRANGIEIGFFEHKEQVILPSDRILYNKKIPVDDPDKKMPEDMLYWSTDLDLSPEIKK